ncbi:disulfide bond formation protein B [Stomatohabitans albus]|uniref:disulfide bond formation protein B n=1 Tax=Stomatohabitans albus TaxID=3110766 RepID=UPI003AB92FA4
MLDTIIVDFTGIATLLTAIAGVVVATKTIPLSRFHLNLLIFAVSFGCLVGSLYMSNVLKLLPCELCWWQRIFIYPLVPLSAVALYKKNTSNLFTNVTTLSVIGLCFSLINIYVQSVPEASTLIVCDPNNPCSAIDVIALNFLTLPMMSAIAFLFFLACAWAARTPVDRMETTHE